MGYSDGVCKICNVMNEDIVHLFDCYPVRTVWDWIEIKLQSINIQYGNLSIFSKIVGTEKPLKATPSPATTSNLRPLFMEPNEYFTFY